MNCPNCGKPTTLDQKFCRSCGASLETDLIDPAREASISRSAKMRRMGLISIFAGLGIAVTGKMLFHLDLVVYVGVLMNFLGMFLIAYPSVVPVRRTKPVPLAVARPAVLETAEATKKLTPMSDHDFIPSVIEGTTELLKMPSSKPAAETNSLKN